mgnify:CR=1 FL=1
MFDIIVVGGGPAGITASIYAKRAGRNVAIIEKYIAGGQLNLIGEIENYTGFENISGFELADKLKQHAKRFDIPFIRDEVVDVNFNGTIKKVICKDKIYEAYAVVLAMGSHPRELNIDGEEKFKGKGVSYCALCDGNFFKGKNVAVVGSGDSAFSDALYLADICSNVYVLTKSQLKLHNYSLDEIEKVDNIKILKNALSKKITGNENVQSLLYSQNEEDKNIDIDAVFVAIGRTPDTNYLNGKIEMTDRGYVKCDRKMKTNVDGVFACGDVREGEIKQIATAVGDGAVAGSEANKYVLITKAKNKI